MIAKTIFPISILFILLSTVGCSVNTPSPRAENGVINLNKTGVSNQVVKLNGEWEFYPYQLLAPHEIDTVQTVPHYLEIPGSWRGSTIEGEALDGRGCATFRLKIELPRKQKNYFLKLYSIHSAYTVWIDGELSGSVGTVKSSAASARPVRKPLTIEIPSAKDSIEVIIQVSNFHYRAGGINTPVVIGNSVTFLETAGQQKAIAFFLIGGILIMALYHLILFYLRREDRASLFFALFCFFACLRILITGEMFTATVFNLTNYRLSLQLEYLTVYLMVPLFILYTKELFPLEINKIFVNLSLLIASVFTLATILFPTYQFTYLMPVYHPLLLVQFIWLIVSLIISKIRSRKGASIFLTGFTLLFFTSLYDALFTYVFIDGTYVLQFAIFLFILSQSSILSIRFADIYKTVEKNEKELQRLINLKNDFLARVTHELRTPLYGIVGTAEMILEKKESSLTDNDRKCLNIIVSDGRRLNRLVNDILDFSKLKSSEIMLFRKQIDLFSLTESMLILLRHSSANKNVELINLVPPDLDLVYADEDRVQQILYNLVGNALKFTDTGKVEVFAQNKRCGFITICVKDTGIGIPHDKLHKIFEPFEQTESSDTRAHEGSGLGLPITKYLIELHGGTITIDSEPQIGTTVSFSIPLSDTASTEFTDATPPDKPFAQSTDIDQDLYPQLIEGNHFHNYPQNSVPSHSNELSGKILVIDDDPLSLSIIEDALTSANFGVIKAQNGFEGLRQINEDCLPDAVVLDMMMPGMSGLQFLKRVRINFSPSELPILMVTAKNQLSDLLKSFESGANDYLTKPFIRHELVTRIKTQVNIKKALITACENIQLREEIDFQKKQQEKLLLLQNRLSFMMDTVEDAVMAVDNKLQICYMNRPCLRTLKYGEIKKDLLLEKLIASNGKKLINHLRSTPTADSRVFRQIRLKAQSKSEPVVDISVCGFKYDTNQLSILVLRDSKSSRKKADASVETFLSMLHNSSQRFSLLGQVLEKLNPDILSKNPQLHNDLHKLSSAIETIKNYPELKTVPADRKNVAVNLLNRAIEVCTEHTTLTKFSLAEQSGLWKVHTNADGWQRTQTLDRYLTTRTFPKYPKWETIEKTVKFVIARLDKKPALQQELEEMLRVYKSMG
ncbi:ATP-binding protein [Chitinispirillales bacterium ANBcel5]|uniref:ATP-binding protein n=1 Tax=Cellulosispirillum alkaliphilum TaxID=3039283 RepID=UPI002A5796A3|nr:ATP-binding protein [Chitinispirillales bacterium ANBcel5]